MIVKNDLFDYKNRYIYQDSELFKFSLDSILLAEFANKFRLGKQIIDICTGNMAIPLILSTYIKEKIIGFEIQNSVAKLALDSIKENHLEDRLEVICDDAKNIGKYFDNESIDTILCNPPYFKVNNINRVNNNAKLSIARHEIKLTLEDVFKLSKSYLKNKGKLFLVHRAERLDEIIELGYKYQMNVKEIQLVCTKSGEKPYIAIIEAVKNSKQGLKINLPVCIENVKTYQNIFKELT